MGTLKINIAGVLGMSSGISAAKQKISGAEETVASVKNSMDPAIKARSNISSRLSSAERRLDALEKKIGSIQSTADNGANEYQATEKGLKMTAQKTEKVSPKVVKPSRNASAFLEK